jgi:hypothetical protein
MDNYLVLLVVIILGFGLYCYFEIVSKKIEDPKNKKGKKAKDKDKNKEKNKKKLIIKDSPESDDKEIDKDKEIDNDILYDEQSLNSSFSSSIDSINSEISLDSGAKTDEDSI